MDRPAAEDRVPPELRQRNPLITPEASERLRAIQQHADAPIWNYTVGDRVRTEDLPAIALAERSVRQRTSGTGRPPAELLAWVESYRGRSERFSANLHGLDPRHDWDLIPTMDREDIAARIEEVVPVDADLDRLIVYDTSGTTGHAIHVPHHPRAMAQNHPLMLFVLEQYGIRPTFCPDRACCVNVGAQRDTVVFATVFAVWNNAPFVKVNFHPRAWSPQKARRFLHDLNPVLVTGDPVGFAEMLAWGIELSPAAIVSTAVALAEPLKRRLEETYRCPVIDTYASTETGPIAYAAPDGRGMHILPTDIYVEIVDDAGRPLPEGEMGEIVVTGGRNPYVPLLRYRTGDFGRLIWSDRAGNDPAPRLHNLQAREPVLYRAADGSPLNPVDIGRILRIVPIVQHQFHQFADLSLHLRMRMLPGVPPPVPRLRELLSEAFGPVPAIVIEDTPDLGCDEKVVPFTSDLASEA